MVDDPQQPHTDDVARAIRAAIDPPSPAATERIAQRIAAGANTVRAGSTPARHRGWTGRAALRPLVATGVVAIAIGIALLAPGEDGAKRGGGALLQLGPDAAAADVLHTAGAAAGGASWTPLKAGQFFATRRTEIVDDRIRVVTRTWTARDGSQYERSTQSPVLVPKGTEFWVPVVECGPSAVAERALAKPGDVVASLATAACANEPITGGFVTTSTTASDIRDVPPAGAFVELVPWTLAVDVSARALRYGVEVRERAGAQLVSPDVRGERGVIESAEFSTIELPLATRWARRVSEPEIVVDQDVESSPDAGPIVENTTGPRWNDVFTVADLAALPTDPARLAERLRVESGTTTDAAAIQLAVGLLTEAPLAPKVGAATFDALALFTKRGEAASVDRNTTLPDGSPAVAVSFQLEYPKRLEYLARDDDAYRLLFEPRTATLRAVVTRFDGEDVVTEWAAPRRVARIPSRV